MNAIDGVISVVATALITAPHPRALTRTLSLPICLLLLVVVFTPLFRAVTTWAHDEPSQGRVEFVLQQKARERNQGGFGG